MAVQKVFLGMISGRSLLIGLLLCGLGWILLLAANTADASVIDSPICNSCHAASLITLPTIDPCSACHEEKSQPKQVNALRQQALELTNTAPSALRYDVRYKMAIHELETASRIEKYAVQEVTLQQVVAHLTRAEQLLAVLENEVRSGYWESGQKSQDSFPQLNVQFQFQNPAAVRSELLFNFNQDVPSAFLNESLNLSARFLFFFTVQRRGPPSDEAVTDSFLLKRRLPSVMQSLF
ncbi:MAG: hypothetical protein K8I82_13410, partial [Anaerolineae bacterium]|nr:hypothetical protein [Anaerolineae bacterium]